MSDPIAHGGIMAATVVPIIGLVIWLVRWFAEKHVNQVLEHARQDLNEKRKDFLEAMKVAREDFLSETAAQRELYRDEMAEQRRSCTESNQQIVKELQRLSDVLARHEEVLESLLERFEKNER